jgi:hypothetical protein
MRIIHTPRPFKRKLLLALAACAVLAGATTAVVMAAQPSSRSSSAAHPHRGGLLASAAGYLGVTPVQLRSELRSGRSLAEIHLSEIANATTGKSAAGLIAAVEAAQHAKLAALAASVPARVTAEVNAPRHRNRRLAAAAGYLGISAAQVRSELRSGHTLAQLAAASPGRSQAGLVEALVAARKTALAAEVAAGTITQAQANAITGKLARRVTAQVTRVHHTHPASHKHAGASGT